MILCKTNQSRSVHTAHANEYRRFERCVRVRLNSYNRSTSSMTKCSYCDRSGFIFNLNEVTAYTYSTNF